MRGDFASTVRTVHAATRAAHRRAAESLVPDPARVHPLAKAWLEGHVPLTLVMDLAMPHGPHSAELLAAEPGPDAAWWQPSQPARHRPSPLPTRP